MPRFALIGVVLAAVVFRAAPAAVPSAPPSGSLPAIAAKVAGMDKRDGFLPLYWDTKRGKLWLEIPRFGEEFLYYTSLPAGIGSNDIGLDRGQVGRAQVVRFERVGPRILLIESNYAFRADAGDAAAKRAVADAFATSVLWGFEAAAETQGRVVVDATDFALRDGHGVIVALERAKQGKYAIDASRSALWPDRTKAFPKNTEIEATLTFTTTDEPGAWISSVTPSPRAVTLREHHSFVELPGPGFRPRAADPRAGYVSTEYADYAAPLGAPRVKRLAARHRLVKRDPAAAVSEAVEPIVYYLDPAVPEPIRSAVREGARWWNRAFETAGYKNAFRVEMLPPDADPMDVRYNVIQWVHRSTRGWSYGNAVIDPRTGEIVKGHVSLGSLRVRQDYLLAEGLLSPYPTGTEDPPEPSAMALARIRQLAAHEVGHTLGLEHNFLASVEGPGGRASVMDYPHPLTRLRPDGSVDLSDAYAVGIGAWDEVAIAYGYQDFPAGTDEAAALGKILGDGRARGLVFLTDQDARPFGSAHPKASLWDNGTDAAAELDRMMAVRRAALTRFGETAIRSGMPLATMEEALVPLYFHHRYQTTAAAKAIGGLYYTYAMRGDAQEPLRPVPSGEQERALDAVLRTIRPAELAIPRAILDRLPPRPNGYDADRELFARHTGVAFDPLAPAEAAAGLTVSLLLEPDRVARVVAQHALDPALPGLDTVLDRLVGAAFKSFPPANPYEAEIARSVRAVVVDGVEQLAANGSTPQGRSLARLELEQLEASLEADAPGVDAAEKASRHWLAAGIGRFLEGKEDPKANLPLPPPPPGEPIGDDDPLGGAGE